MRRGGAMILGLALACPAGLSAAEKAGAEITQGRATSSLQEISNKPLYIYSARGRRDPFSTSLDLSATALPTQELSVTELRLVGFMEASGVKVALFRHRNVGTTYTFRQGKLFTPENVAVENVVGRLQKGNEVLLVQGERKVLFSPFKSNK